MTLVELEQTKLLLSCHPDSYNLWLCNLALISKLCLCVIKAKTFKHYNLWGFKRGALALVL
jgi:hypothetical protein